MPVVQILSVAGRSAGGGGGGGGTGPALTPVDTGIGLGTSWTVELVGEFYPSQYWATIWGNESWNAGLGHLAYLTGPTSLSVGRPNLENYYTLAQPVSVKSYWAFVHSDGSGIDVYRNGSLLTPSSGNYVQPSPAGNSLIFGARHNNDGTGQTDAITNGTFYWTNITSTPFNAGDILSQYITLQSQYPGI